MARDNRGDLKIEPGEGGAHFVLTLAPAHPDGRKPAQEDSP
jgi:hypothetical protein